jgi:class 3 adenylate cyclase
MPRGRTVKTTGDGLLLEFPSVVDAVRCVVEVQTAVAEKGAHVAEYGRLAFRIGLHVGDIIIAMATTFLATASILPHVYRRSRHLAACAFLA